MKMWLQMPQSNVHKIFVFNMTYLNVYGQIRVNIFHDDNQFAIETQFGAFF
jgi:hypothetical protein